MYTTAYYEIVSASLSIPPYVCSINKGTQGIFVVPEQLVSVHDACLLVLQEPSLVVLFYKLHHDRKVLMIKHVQRTISF